MGYKPTITKIDAFDAKIGTTVYFGWNGTNAAKGNTLTIKDLDDKTVYEHTIENSFELYHKMDLTKATAGFVNGNRYYATLVVWDIKGNPSDVSDPVIFYCFTTPEFEIINEFVKGEEENNIVQTSSFYLEIKYKQVEQEVLNKYIVKLYDSNNQALLQSDEYITSIHDGILTYYIEGLDDNHKYKVYVDGITANGMVIKTPEVIFSVGYDELGIGAKVRLNDIGDGKISISSNFKIIGVRANPDPPGYINNEEVDLRDKGSYVEYYDGFKISGNFECKIALRDPNVGSICTMKNDNGDILRLTYEYYDIDYLEEIDGVSVIKTMRKYFFKLNVSGKVTNINLFTDMFDKPVSSQRMYILIQHKCGYYDLKLKFGESDGSNVAITYHLDKDKDLYETTVTAGDSILASCDLVTEKDGYDFVGWSTSPNASIEYIINEDAIATNDIDLYAVFGKNVALTYYDNSETASVKNDIIYYNNGTMGYPKYTMTQSLKSGWDALGWSTTNKGDADINYANESSITLTSNMTIYGLYSQSVTLACYDNGGVTRTPFTRYWAPSGYENPKTTITQSAKSGWTKAGWGTNPSGNANKAYDSDTIIVVNGNISIYGLYYKTFTCTFKTYNSSSNQTGKNCYNSSGQTYSYVTAPTGKNVSYIIPGSEVTSDWTWLGWSKAGQTDAVTSATYVNGKEIAGASSGNVYYGLYHRKTSIKYVQNGGSTSSATGDSYYNAYGNYNKAKFTAPVVNALSGWNIYGWSAANKTAANTERFCGSGKPFEQASDATLYALYQRTITLSYNSNGGSGSMTPHTATQQYNVSSSGNTTKHKFTLKTCSFSYTNNTFQLWAEGSVSGAKKAAGSTVEISKNTTYYAIWDSNDISGQTLYSGTGGVEVQTGSFNTTGYGSVAISLIASSGWGYYGLVTGQQSSVNWTKQGENGSITINLPANAGVQYFSWCVGMNTEYGGSDENTSWKIVVNAS